MITQEEIATGMTSNQTFILAIVGLVVGMLTPVVTQIVLYIKQKAERKLVVETVKETAASAKIDRDLVVTTVKASADLVQETTAKTTGQLTDLKEGQDEMHHAVNGNLEKAMNRIASLEEALKAAGVMVPASPQTATQTPAALAKGGSPTRPKP